MIYIAHQAGELMLSRVTLDYIFSKVCRVNWKRLKASKKGLLSRMLQQLLPPIDESDELVRRSVGSKDPLKWRAH